MTHKTNKIGICINPTIKQHSTDWSNPWVEFCNNNKLEYEIINPYLSDVITTIKKVDVLLWHFSGYNFQDMLVARSILYSAKNMGIKVFPDFDDAWHFDDKVAETYLLQGIKASIPESHMLYTLDDIKQFLDRNASFPYVAKLRNGSGSHNVKLIKDENHLTAYAKKMFSKGFPSSPSLLYKASSNIKSSKSLKTYINRVKRIPEFLRTLRASKSFPNEKGYVFLQEFIPNDGYDLKVVVVGDKLSFIGRNIREGEFRASGGGDLFYDKKYITKSIIDSAFTTSDKLGFKCMGYDYVVNNTTNQPKIVEISYGFSHAALLQAGGYFDRNGDWHNEPLNAPHELLANLLNIS